MKIFVRLVFLFENIIFSEFTFKSNANAQKPRNKFTKVNIFILKYKNKSYSFIYLLRITTLIYNLLKISKKKQCGIFPLQVLFKWKNVVSTAVEHEASF